VGRWSIGPNSRGNFVYVFDGLVPFDTMIKYERFLLQPFSGGQLCLTLGWSHFVAHGVPFLDESDRASGPDSLDSEL